MTRLDKFCIFNYLFQNWDNTVFLYTIKGDGMGPNLTTIQISYIMEISIIPKRHSYFKMNIRLLKEVRE